jgi:hypothetical protein
MIKNKKMRSIREKGYPAASLETTVFLMAGRMDDNSSMVPGRHNGKRG